MLQGFIAHSCTSYLARSLFSLAFGAIIIGASQAQDPGIYLDIGYQAIDLDGDDEFLPATYDAKLGAISGHAGYRISSFLAIEGEFALGVDGDKDIATYDPAINFIAPPPIIDLKQDFLIGASVRLQHDLGENFTGFVKGGIAHSEFKLTRTSFQISQILSRSLAKL